MASPDACRREIEELHDLFVREYALVRYEEWQSAGNGETVTGRLSTALLESNETPAESAGSEPQSDRTRPAARWLHLQETWLDGPDSPPSP